VIEGFIQGLYNSPPDVCPLCSSLGAAGGTLQSNFISLENNREKWVDIAAVFKMDFFSQVSRLLELLVLFATTAISIDTFVKSKEIMGLLDFMVKRMEPAFLDQMQMNVLDNIS
jgi:hypothetical protein